MRLIIILHLYTNVHSQYIIDSCGCNTMDTKPCGCMPPSSVIYSPPQVMAPPRDIPFARNSDSLYTPLPQQIILPHQAQYPPALIYGTPTPNYGIGTIPLVPQLPQPPNTVLPSTLIYGGYGIQYKPYLRT